MPTSGAAGATRQSTLHFISSGRSEAVSRSLWKREIVSSILTALTLIFQAVAKSGIALARDARDRRFESGQPDCKEAQQDVAKSGYRARFGSERSQVQFLPS
jgi:hypothetical protein